MADMKFSCPHCGQHISCDEAWAGHQIACPACHDPIVVPQLQAPSVEPAPAVPAREVSKAGAPMLAAGVTQVARSTAHAPAPVKKIIPRQPRSNNSLVGYAILLLVIVGLAWLGYAYGLPMLKDTFQQAPSSGPAAGAGASGNGGTRGGPLGEVNEAMDASEALDGGSSARTRSPPATNSPARPQPAARPR